MKGVTVLLSLLLSLLINIGRSKVSSFTSCMTDNNQPGQCIHAINCPGKQYVGCSDKQGFVCCEDEVNIDGLRLLNQSDICGSFEDSKIKGGHEVEVHSRPWMALLISKDLNDVETILCGGTLITPRFILTAAHCFMDDKREINFVRLGEHKISQENYCSRQICEEPHENFGIERITKHENFQPNYGLNDIALVKVSKEVIYKGHICPICLPIEDELRDKPLTTNFFKVSGWGRTEEGNSSDVLREVILPRAHRRLCVQEYGAKRRVGRNQLCVGFQNEEKDSCMGDSGGPLSAVTPCNGVQRFVQMGIVSYGRRCDSSQAPGVYTNVAKYIPWISRNIVA